MNSIETKNAVIEGAEIFIEGHGMLTAYVYLDYGGSSGQGFGGYNLDWGPYMAAFIKGVLSAANVEKWSDLKGKTVRVKCEWTAVHEIGHIIKDDLWFNPKEAFEGLEKSEEVAQ